MYKFFIPFIALSICLHASAQLTLSGVVLDNSKMNYVEGAAVFTNSGKVSLTDSLGKYKIAITPTDSVYFVYNNKPTQKFAVATIPNTDQFDISIQIPVKSKFSMLKEVIVQSKSYKRDSAENRNEYAKYFNFKPNGITTTVTPTGAVGMDATSLINMFRFKRNKQLKKFQIWLEKDEQEKYVNYRFSKRFVGRVTQLKGAMLDTFLVWYRPSYKFVASSTEITYNEYVLNASYHFKKIISAKGLGIGKKNEEDE